MGAAKIRGYIEVPWLRSTLRLFIDAVQLNNRRLLGFNLQCTKVLIRFDVRVNVMKMNAANEQGDTPLHLASRWGYGKITWVVYVSDFDIDFVLMYLPIEQGILEAVIVSCVILI